MRVFSTRGPVTSKSVVRSDTNLNSSKILCLFRLSASLMMTQLKLMRTVAGQRSSPESGFANKTKMFFRAKNKRNHWTVKYRSLRPKFILRSKVVLH